MAFPKIEDRSGPTLEDACDLDMAIVLSSGHWVAGTKVKSGQVPSGAPEGQGT